MKGPSVVPRPAVTPPAPRKLRDRRSTCSPPSTRAPAACLPVRAAPASASASASASLLAWRTRGDERWSAGAVRWLRSDDRGRGRVRRRVSSPSRYACVEVYPGIDRRRSPHATLSPGLWLPEGPAQDVPGNGLLWSGSRRVPRAVASGSPTAGCRPRRLVGLPATRMRGLGVRAPAADGRVERTRGRLSRSPLPRALNGSYRGAVPGDPSAHAVQPAGVLQFDTAYPVLAAGSARPGRGSGSALGAAGPGAPAAKISSCATAGR
jgi:hypothetical protein